MKIVYRAENIIDANLIKDALEHAGILAYVSGYYLSGAAGELPALGLVNVMIAEQQFEEAEPVVARMDEFLREARAAVDEDFGADDLPHPA